MKNPRYSRKVLAMLGLFVAIAVWFVPAAFAAAFANNTFTVGVIPDTQFYVDSGNTLTTVPAYTQPNANNSAQYFQAETQWFVNNQAALNLVFVTHVGDVVQNGDGTSDGTTPLQGIWPVTAEWDRALAAMQILANANIPFGMSPGNHDYDNYFHATNSRPLAETTGRWTRYFGSGSSLFAGKTWYGGASDSLTCDPGLSSYQTFTGGGRKFLHISLELEAGTAAIQWAQGVINAHRGYATIVTTHSYISPFAAGSMEPPATQGGPNATYNASSFLTNSPCGWNGAANVFADLIYPNDQIFLVISGHSYNTTNLTGSSPGSSQGEGIRIDNNIAGHPVYQVLTDFQDNIVNHDGSALPAGFVAPPYSHASNAAGTAGAANSVPYVSGVSDPGGDGWVRLMTFDMTAGLIHFWTYSPLLVNGQSVTGTYAGQCGGSPCDCSTNTCDETFEQPAAFSDFYWEKPMPVQVLNAASQFSYQIGNVVYNRATKTYNSTLTITNTGAGYAEAINVALNNLTAGVTLTDATGTYNGAPSVTASTTGLAAGASATVPLTFSDPSNAEINFTPVTY
jgi:hypothetical protein